jgi:hypothetical protein
MFGVRPLLGCERQKTVCEESISRSERKHFSRIVGCRSTLGRERKRSSVESGHVILHQAPWPRGKFRLGI